MATLRAVLPPVTAPVMPMEKARVVKSQGGASSHIPPYGQRKGWVPREVEDFGDGGAFPEIHVAQYPLEMGRKKTPSNSKAVIPVSVDGDGKVKYDALLHNKDSKAIIYSKYADSVASTASEEALAKPDPTEAEKTTERTKAALLGALQAKTTGVAKNNDAVFIKYTPQSAGSDGEEKIIRLVEVQKDPLEPPKFKNKKVPVLNTEAPAPVMHSPPRKATQEEIQDWKIPPCVSNWKNPRGYTIPLDKRLAADGRGLQQPHINDNFAKIAEALYTAERTARDAVTQRAMVKEKLAIKEMQAKEEMLRKVAQETREKRASGSSHNERYDMSSKEAREKAERDKIREDRKRDRERERRMEAMGSKKSKLTRDEERDVSEKIALGELPASAARSSEALYDQRLFNQSQGMDSGFGEEEAYNIYDKPLFAGTNNGQLYHHKKTEEEDEKISEGTMKRIMDTSKFRPDKGFQGTDRGEGASRGSAPVEFEKHNEDEADPFGLEELLSQAKTGAKKKT